MARTTTMLKSGALLAMSALLMLSMLAGEAHADEFCYFGCQTRNCGRRRCKDTSFFRCECVDW
jgi:hypothetical protein